MARVVATVFVFLYMSVISREARPACGMKCEIGDRPDAAVCEAGGATPEPVGMEGCAYEDVLIELVCENATADSVLALVKALNDQRCIKVACRKELGEGKAVIEVRLFGNADFLAGLIADMSNGPAVEIMGKDEKTVTIKFAGTDIQENRLRLSL